MRRSLASAVMALVVSSALGTLAPAATGKPYVGSWKARVTADQLLYEGIVDPRMPGTWRLRLAGNGTYRLYNPLDGWTSGMYSANATRFVVSKDAACLRSGFKGPGVYRWSVTKQRLKLTAVSVGSDPCGGRWQSLAIPLWQRA